MADCEKVVRAVVDGWAAVFLTSPEARWITGQLLCVDSGVKLMSPTRAVGGESRT